MKKNEINALLRAYIRENLSPTNAERAFVSDVYSSVCQVLGVENCLQIGSYPRFTAVTPLHDLDVLFILGEWLEGADPSEILGELETALRKNYKNPTKYKVGISRQTHSITLSFEENGEEVFAVDVVPAYALANNEFGDKTYMVPELVSKSHGQRMVLMAENVRLGRAMTWIKTDPRGYIAVATNLNAGNDDFRKSVKLVKGWRAFCKADDEEFPLKSFHIEQILTDFFEKNPGVEIFDAVFRFFCDLPSFLERPSIPDRADATRFVDAYISDLDPGQIKKIAEARDHLLIALENFEPGSNVGDILEAGYRKRSCVSEQYLFDFGIPVLTEAEFRIVAKVQERKGGFRAMILDALGIIDVDRKIEFTLGTDAPAVDFFKWKVKNDDNSAQPRGEISDHGTLRNPEHTKYRGHHLVECFAIKNDVCVARARQNVVLGQ